MIVIIDTESPLLYPYPLAMFPIGIIGEGNIVIKFIRHIVTEAGSVLAKKRVFEQDGGRNRCHWKEEIRVVIADFDSGVEKFMVERHLILRLVPLTRYTESSLGYP